MKSLDRDHRFKEKKIWGEGGREKKKRERMKDRERRKKRENEELTEEHNPSSSWHDQRWESHRPGWPP